MTMTKQLQHSSVILMILDIQVSSHKLFRISNKNSSHMFIYSLKTMMDITHPDFVGVV